MKGLISKLKAWYFGSNVAVCGEGFIGIRHEVHWTAKIIRCISSAASRNKDALFVGIAITYLTFALQRQ